jgi:hypothetical protein
MKILAAFIIFMCLTGCMGTYMTRIEPINGSFCGKSPYESLAADGFLVSHIGGGRDTSTNGSYDNGMGAFAWFGLFSIPVDFVVDTVLLPIDLIAWPLGYKKGEW